MGGCSFQLPGGRLTAHVRTEGRHVGVIAVDPTSPYSGGAILGDRVRMQQHVADSGVFIRSMATRGHLGGLARTTSDCAVVLDAAGKSIVIVETVGVGQDEVDIVRTADISIVVLVPGTGDDVQALKAGIMEIADIYVVNKADREGAERMVTSIESNLALQAFSAGQWRPPIVRTEATTGTGQARMARTTSRSSPRPSWTSSPVASGAINSTYTAGFSVTAYELYFFGRVRALSQAPAPMPPKAMSPPISPPRKLPTSSSSASPSRTRPA